MHRPRLLALAVVGAVAVSACSGSVEVTTERADPISIVEPSVDNPTIVAPPEDPAAEEPVPEDSTPSAPAATGGIVDREAINFGPNKPARAHDDFLLAVMTDVELWWTQIFPAIYGEPFTPL